MINILQPHFPALRSENVRNPTSELKAGAYGGFQKGEVS